MRLITVALFLILVSFAFAKNKIECREGCDVDLDVCERICTKWNKPKSCFNACAVERQKCKQNKISCWENCQIDVLACERGCKGNSKCLTECKKDIVCEPMKQKGFDFCGKNTKLDFVGSCECLMGWCRKWWFARDCDVRCK